MHRSNNGPQLKLPREATALSALPQSQKNPSEAVQVRRELHFKQPSSRGQSIHDFAGFLDLHGVLLQQLLDVQEKQAELWELLNKSDERDDEDMNKLLEALQRLAKEISAGAERKDLIRKAADKETQSKLQHCEDLNADVTKHQALKDEKTAVLQDIHKLLQAYEGTSTENSSFKKAKGEPYEVLPQVEVTIYVKSLSSVDTNAMTFEVDCIIFLDWLDPKIFEMYTEDATNFNLNELDWTVLFNPFIDAGNKSPGCTLYGGDIPQFAENDRDDHGNPNPHENRDVFGSLLNEKAFWMTKRVHLKGALSLNSVDLTCFPFDMQVLTIMLEAQRTSCPNKTRVKKFQLVHSVLRHAKDQELHTSRHWTTDEFKYHNREADAGKTGHYFVLNRVDQTLTDFEFCSMRCKQGKIDGTFGQASKQNGDAEKATVLKQANYQIHILVERPIMGTHYVWELGVLVVLVSLTSFSFWDTAAPELSSRMSITLTLILTLAAFTSERPAEIAKIPSLTFQDRYETACFFMVAMVSVLNVISVTICGGEHPEAPEYMLKMYSPVACQKGWCQSRVVDCTFFMGFVIALAMMHILFYCWVRKARGNRTKLLVPMVKATTEDLRLRYHMRLQESASELEKNMEQSLIQDRWTFISGAFLTALVIFGFWALAAPLQKAAQFLRSSGFLRWPLFGLGYLATGFPFIPGHHILLIAAGYMFGLVDGLALTEIGTAFSAVLGYAITGLVWRRWMQRYIESFPSFVKVKIFAFLDAEVTSTHWQQFRRICAMRNNIEFTFGLVNAIVGISSTDVFTHIIATMLSSQPQIVMWVSIGTALQMLNAEVHSSGSEYGHGDEINLNFVLLCIAGSFVIRLFLGCVSRRVLMSSFI